MLWIVSVILFGLWLLGVVSGGADGAWVHLLLAYATLSLVLAVVTAHPRRIARQ